MRQASSAISETEAGSSSQDFSNLINHASFPLDEDSWDFLWNRLRTHHPNAVLIERNIRSAISLPEIPVPSVPSFYPAMGVVQKVNLVQGYLSALQYNHTGLQLFDIKKNRSLVGLMDVAKNMTRYSLPIKCLEACVLGIYLTAGFSDLERFPISFKSVSQGRVHRHIVLGLSYNGVYGSIGLSRKSDLMYKPLRFETLSSLLTDFIECYNKYLHHVRKIKIGLPVSHDQHSCEPICWKHCVLSVEKLTRSELCEEIQKFAKFLRKYRVYRSD